MCDELDWSSLDVSPISGAPVSLAYYQLLPAPPKALRLFTRYLTSLFDAESADLYAVNLLPLGECRPWITRFSPPFLGSCSCVDFQCPLPCPPLCFIWPPLPPFVRFAQPHSMCSEFQWALWWSRRHPPTLFPSPRSTSITEDSHHAATNASDICHPSISHC